MKLTLARPEHAPAISAFYREVHPEGFDHEEMYSDATVQQLLRDGEIEVLVASANREVVGCGLGLPRPWNQSLEIGALSVKPIEGRAKAGKAMFEALRRVGLQKYGLTLFRARSEGAFKRGRNVGAICWGYWPSPGGPLEDAELLMGMFNEHSDAPRIEPPDNALTRMAFPSRVLGAYTRAEPGLAYPKNYPVGAPRGTGTPVFSGRIWPTFHSRENYLTIESSAGPYPIEVIQGFVEKVRAKGVQDIRLTLPVNQDEVFFDLIKLGFKATAYLPGWFLRGPYRYDCIQMSAGVPPARGTGAFVTRVIQKLDEGFGS